MKKLGIVDVNNFVVQAMIIRFHLKGRNYVWSNKTLAFRVLFCQLGLQDFFKWKNVLHRPASSRRIGQFWFLDHLNLSSYAKVVAITISVCQEEKSDAWSQTSIRLMSDGKRADFGPQDGPESKKRSTWKFLEISRATTLMFWVFSSEVVCSPKTSKNRTAVLGPLVIRVRLCLERFGRDLKSFSCTESPASSYIDEVTADWDNTQSQTHLNPSFIYFSTYLLPRSSLVLILAGQRSARALGAISST